ncbi:hypothetical protein BN903_55 [Halorubrum sp. AJ67]|nr:hypothetical protein BN903_55 [Halorubrum sp. AJ67]
MITQPFAAADPAGRIDGPHTGNRLIPGPDPDTTIPREEP